MSVVGILPTEIPAVATPGQMFLTFVVPTPGGCDLKCGFCFIRQRREIAAAVLQPHHYAQFIREAAASARPYAVSIQGYEPLLPASRPYTQAILATARLLGLPSALVTNGTHLAEAADWLATLGLAQIAISLDAASPGAHDRLRGVPGAWTATIMGIERAVSVLAPRSGVAVSSVLMPSGCGPLEAMPDLLGRLGVRHWIVTPLLKVGRDAPGGPMGELSAVYRSAARLQDAADAAGVNLIIDDELDCMQHARAAAAQPALRRFHVRTLPKGIGLMRMTPDGTCSVAGDILRRVRVAAPRWHPAETHAGDFLARLLAPVELAELAG